MTLILSRPNRSLRLHFARKAGPLFSAPFPTMNLPIAPAEAPIGPPRGEKFSGPGMETDHFCAQKSTQQQSRYSRDRHHYQQVSVSASEQAIKANKLSVICSADKHFYSHLTSGITLHVACPRRPKLRRCYLATQHKRRDARRISSFWQWPLCFLTHVSQALSQPITLNLM